MCRPLSDRLLDWRGLFLERPFSLAEHRSFDRVWVLFFYRRWSLCLLTLTCFGAANRKSPGKIPGPHFLSPRIVSSPYRPCRPALRARGTPSSAAARRVFDRGASHHHRGDGGRSAPGKGPVAFGFDAQD